MIKTPGFRFGIWLAGYVRTTYNLDGDNVSGGGSSGADCRKPTATNYRAERIPCHDLTFIVWKNEGGIDVWTEGREE